VLGVISVLCLLSPVIAGLASAATTYDGNCYTLTDGSRPCTQWEYARNEMYLVFTLSISPAMFLLAGWLTALGFWFALSQRPGQKTLPTWQVVLIPLLACAIGACLIYLIPLALGMRR
jgi:hypothetical protein